MSRPYLAACMTFANHGRYLREWLEFHRLVGFERFFLYDNGSADDSAQVLAPYVDAGLVTVHDWPGRGVQPAAFSDCLDKHRDEARWIAFFDVDEFLFNPRGRAVPDVLRDFEPYPGVGVNTVSFGTSGHRKRPQGLVTESYLYRTGARSILEIKSIVDPRRAIRAIGPHRFEYTSGEAVDVEQQPLLGAKSQSYKTARLRINHYYTKSEEELLEKWSLPRPDTGAEREPVDVERLRFLEQRYERDETILQYLPALKAAMRRPAP